MSLSWVQEEPPSLRLEQEGGQGSPGFFCSTLTYPFCLDGGFVCRAHSGASRSRWVSTGLQEEPPSLCTGREGRRELPWLFIRPSCLRVCLPRPLWARALVMGSRRGCRKGSLASARSRGPSGAPLAFCTTLALPFCSEGGVVLPSPLECEPGSLGLGKLAGRAP